MPAPSPRAAIAFMLAASALVAATTLMAKGLGQAGLHPFQVSAGRFLFALATLLLFLAVQPQRRPSLVAVPWRLHLLRSVLGWLGVTAMFAAAARMPLAEATAISFLNPLVTMGLAILLLGELLTLRKIIAAVLAVLGAMLILKPGTDAFQAAGLLALAAAALLGMEAVVIKRLSGSEPALRLLLINNALGAVIALIAASFVWTWPTVSLWLLSMALGATMVSAQSLFIQSMRRGEASTVMPILYAVLGFAVLYDALIFRVMPDGLALTGIVLIGASGVLLAVKLKRL